MIQIGYYSESQRLIKYICQHSRRMGKQSNFGSKKKLTQSVWAAVTKIAETGCLKQQTFLSHSYGGWEIQDEGIS